ncbi:RusA family crossover junction endodeoxyribonuclease [Weissella coleopterorum]|uniref:RusA family crossover junction endodeoxyribonuclease n=1 Tax=Weissella coleopterorum TaxID=2714949 RepID=A0A6G8AY53_9LACO|nr:RusA family crossover junction endodeoxyribonuclease [Weissella coleopterorum]QIL49885.1 RusA family crossover junction endodeoxyribonuclease [Weissella coleopterorum]
MKIFEAMIELRDDIDFGSGNDLQHNTRTNQVYRGAKYRKYKDYVIEVLEELADETKLAQIEAETELKCELAFIFDKLVLTKRNTRDLDNLTKPTNDAIQEALNIDDAQIVDLHVKKTNGPKKALFVRLSTVE